MANVIRAARDVNNAASCRVINARNTKSGLTEVSASKTPSWLNVSLPTTHQNPQRVQPWGTPQGGEGARSAPRSRYTQACRSTHWVFPHTAGGPHTHASHSSCSPSLRGTKTHACITFTLLLVPTWHMNTCLHHTHAAACPYVGQEHMHVSHSPCSLFLRGTRTCITFILQLVTRTHTGACEKLYNFFYK